MSLLTVFGIGIIVALSGLVAAFINIYHAIKNNYTLKDAELIQLVNPAAWQRHLVFSGFILVGLVISAVTAIISLAGWVL